MTKKELDALEKLYVAEINSAVDKANNFTHLVQSKSKVYTKLAQEGYCEEKTIEYPGDRFGKIVITGWQLTLQGNFAYCMSCCGKGDD